VANFPLMRFELNFRNLNFGTSYVFIPSLLTIL
jgi:hypothetical protein